MKNIRRHLITLFFGVMALTWFLIVRPADLISVVADAAETSGAPADTGTPTDAVTETPSVTPTVTPTPPASTEGIGNVYVLYKTEEISVEANKQVYYCILKKNTDTVAKAVDLIPAAKSEAYKYLIDISALSASKNCFIGLSTSRTPDEKGLVIVKNITVTATQKKVVFIINWGIEGNTAYSSNVISSVVVSNNDSTVVTYKKLGGVSTAETRSIDLLSIQWKKGNNGDWESIATLSAAKWLSMKQAGATIYLRLAAIDQSAVNAGQRCSKETKTKLAITKAPNMKVDINKLSVALKNGMQFRIDGADKWITVLPFLSRSTTKSGVIRNVLLNTLFDPFTENTLEKKTYMTLDELYGIVGYIPQAGVQSTLSIEYRLAATIKKAASKTGVLIIPSQTDAPLVSITSENNKYKVSKLEKAATDSTTKLSYEYTIVSTVDITAQKLDMAALKWSSIKLGSMLLPTVKSTYTLTDKVRKTVVLSDAGAVMLIRRRGIAGSTKVLPILPSKYAAVTMPALNASTTPTVTPTP